MSLRGWERVFSIAPMTTAPLAVVGGARRGGPERAEAFLRAFRLPDQPVEARRVAVREGYRQLVGDPLGGPARRAGLDAVDRVEIGRDRSPVRVGSGTVGAVGGAEATADGATGRAAGAGVGRGGSGACARETGERTTCLAGAPAGGTADVAGPEARPRRNATARSDPAATPTRTPLFTLTFSLAFPAGRTADLPQLRPDRLEVGVGCGLRGELRVQLQRPAGRGEGAGPRPRRRAG